MMIDDRQRDVTPVADDLDRKACLEQLRDVASADRMGRHARRPSPQKHYFGDGDDCVMATVGLHVVEVGLLRDHQIRVSTRPAKKVSKVSSTTVPTSR